MQKESFNYHQEGDCKYFLIFPLNECLNIHMNNFDCEMCLQIPCKI